MRTALLALLLVLIPGEAYSSVSVNVNGSAYTIPQTNEKGWGANVTSWIQAISAASLYPNSASFTLGAELDFGASFGLKSIYYKSATATPATAGQIRLANTDVIDWRNAANSANLALGVDSSNRLTFNGSPFLPTAALTASRALVSDASGVVAASSTTTTQLQYLNAATGTTGTTSTNLVFSTSPTLTTPVIASSTSGSGTITFNTSGTVTVPNGTDTLVSKTSTDVLTNKTLTSPTMTGPTVSSGTTTFTALTASTVPYLNASKALTSSAVSDTQLGYLSGATGTTGSGSITFAASPTLTGTLTAAAITASGNITASNNTASRVVTTDASKVLTSASTTTTQVNYLSSATGTTGTTSSNLVFSLSPTFSGTTTFPGSTFIDSSGNLGVGVSPTNLLDVYKSSTGTVIAQVKNDNAGASARAQFSVVSDSNSFNIQANSSAGADFITVLSSGAANGTSFGSSDATQISLTTNNAARLTIDSSGYYKSGGGVTAVTSCGTSPSIAGNDNAGTVTVGTGGVATSCTVTFSGTRSSTPRCFANNQTQIVAMKGVPSTTTYVISATAAFTAGSLIDYWCIQ